jgi:hypothetical protein
LGADGAHYYQLKNLGVQRSSGEIVAFTDSDALPHYGWLQTIAGGIMNGAAAVAGITLFRWEDGSERFPGLLTAAASISWGFIVGDPPRGFLSHNFAFRRSDFEYLTYREDLGRTCAGSFLYAALIREKLPIRFQPEQRVSHTFSFGWWITRLHVRFGHEVYLLRRLNRDAPHRWSSRLSLLEPLATMAWQYRLYSANSGALFRRSWGGSGRDVRNIIFPWSYGALREINLGLLNRGDRCRVGQRVLRG